MKCRPLALLLVVNSCVGLPAVWVGPTTERLEVDKTLLELLDRMHGEFENEFVVCLTGVSFDGVLQVTGIAPTKIYEATPTSVQHGGCDAARFVGAMHNHPNGGCAFSQKDIATAERFGHLVDLVSCGRGQFGYRLHAASGRVSATEP